MYVCSKYVLCLRTFSVCVCVCVCALCVVSITRAHACARAGKIVTSYTLVFLFFIDILSCRGGHKAR